MKEKIIEIEKTIHASLRELSDSIFEHPETAFNEKFACDAHCKLLKEHGFQIEEGLVGLDTAFKAVYESKKEGPVVCYMAEYDALPEIGHGCGHNMLGTVSTGAAIVLRYLSDEIGGKVVLLGTPAEETCGAKVEMAKEGVFKDMDVAIMAHPDTNYILSSRSLAIQPIAFEFFGKTAHAASNPEKGVNALDALILTFNNINALREHILSSARIHGIIRNGGEAANIVPDFSRGEFYVRARTKKYLNELVEKVIQCAQAGAVATGCTLKQDEFEPPYDDLVTNERLNQVFKEGVSLFTEDEIKPGNEEMGSLDAGNVSHEIPCIHGYFPIADHKIPGHTREFAQATKTNYAYNKMAEIVSILAYCGYRVITDNQLLGEIKEEYQENVKKGLIVPHA